MNFGLHYFNNNVTDQTALQNELYHECTRIGQLEGQAAGAQCHTMVQTNIAKIYTVRLSA